MTKKTVSLVEGYQPQVKKPYTVKDLKPPKGGTSIQPPKKPATGKS